MVPGKVTENKGENVEWWRTWEYGLLSDHVSVGELRNQTATVIRTSC